LVKLSLASPRKAHGRELPSGLAGQRQRLGGRIRERNGGNLRLPSSGLAVRGWRGSDRREALLALADFAPYYEICMVCKWAGTDSGYR
jgi:hypothetical protein